VLLAHVILWAMIGYALIGLLVAVWFVATQVERIDPAARAAPWSFKLIILPGAAALWPVVLGWSRRGRTGRTAR